MATGTKFAPLHTNCDTIARMRDMMSGFDPYLILCSCSTCLDSATKKVKLAIASRSSSSSTTENSTCFG